MRKEGLTSSEGAKPLNTRCLEEGQKIAQQLGGEVIYKSPWLPDGPKGEFLGHFFTDRVTGSSFAAKTLEEAKAILIQSRKDWGAKPPVFAKAPNFLRGI